MTEKIGPVQVLAVGFDPDARFEGRIMDELANLERHETIRILDLLFVGKDAETGDLLALDYQGEELGAIVGALLGFDFGGEQPSELSEVEGHAFGLSQREIQGIAASLHPGDSAGFLLSAPYASSCVAIVLGGRGKSEVRSASQTSSRWLDFRELRKREVHADVKVCIAPPR